MPFILGNAVSNLCHLAKDMLSQSEFHRAISNIDAPTEDLPVVKNNILYWNLTNGQGFVVIDPKAGKAYRVFRLEDQLSSDYLCDPGLAMAVIYDILNFIDEVNSQIKLEMLLVDEGPDNNANGFVH